MSVLLEFKPLMSKRKPGQSVPSWQVDLFVELTTFLADRGYYPGNAAIAAAVMLLSDREFLWVNNEDGQWLS